ncbi:MAG: A/G-specific adenine glycosylase [Gammaproteobacteria bacterium]
MRGDHSPGEKPITFSKKLLAWYDTQGRQNLPWRQNITPYRVWVSEIMLQQTQVKTVIPYFNRFMQHFPTLQHLAEADIDHVLHLWTGLGYYARARNLHRAAQLVLQQHAGQFPRDVASLQALPGIGRSTAGAIAAISYQQRAPILDGNVRRILSRLHRVAGNPQDPATLKALWTLAEDYTPSQRTADYTQAMMDLGAMLCLRGTPACEQCPVTSHCQAYQQGQQKQFPHPKPRKTQPIRTTRLLILQDIQQQTILLEKRPAKGIWGGLWSLPECAWDIDLAHWCQQHYQYEVMDSESLPEFRHTFTHFHLDIQPFYLKGKPRASTNLDSQRQVWYKPQQIALLGLPAPVKRLLYDTTDFLQKTTERS